MGDGEGQSSVVPVKEERIDQRQIEEEEQSGLALHLEGEGRRSLGFLPDPWVEWGGIGSGITKRGAYLGAGVLELFELEMCCGDNQVEMFNERLDTYV